MLWWSINSLLTTIIALAACARTAVAPSSDRAFYQPLSAGTWPFTWTPIDSAERYLLYVYDFTRATDEYREGASHYAEIETVETRANSDLEAGRLYLFEVAAFDGFELVGKSLAWAIQVP